MFYRPNFCCCCGEKIDRIDWPLLASRRFCELCETEKKLYDIAPRLLVVLGVLMSLFGIGALYSGGADANSPGTAAAPQKFVKTAAASKPSPSAEPPPSVTPSPQPTLKAAAAKTPEAVYYCGAPTKKGTPCTRRVKTKGYCWQHEGRVENENFDPGRSDHPES